ncbi:PepSY domain-containing protein [Cupriavidus basilensis]|uniref:PepSY domain-containing protein n=1 Tax=Cupriavidus basilensis TaxID=68895 RepID=A0ABT6B530_9BURK|nr:PepSY domain-containing protein [Cupriavidus basilensis]MDF3839992.1 PepSY domain-containing protein [Cupriavidus basilensis]
MYRFSKKTLVAAAIVAMGGAGTAAYAARYFENDVLAIANTKIPLVQAIATAEQHANGKAIRAEFDQGLYDVEVVSGGNVFDVRVDADKGTVISSAKDTGDREDDEHDDDDRGRRHGS